MKDMSDYELLREKILLYLKYCPFSIGITYTQQLMIRSLQNCDNCKAERSTARGCFNVFTWMFNHNKEFHDYWIAGEGLDDYDYYRVALKTMDAGLADVESLIALISYAGWCPNSIDNDPMRQALSTKCSKHCGPPFTCHDKVEQYMACWKEFIRLYRIDKAFRKDWNRGDIL